MSNNVCQLSNTAVMLMSFLSAKFVIFVQSADYLLVTKSFVPPTNFFIGRPTQLSDFLIANIGDVHRPINVCRLSNTSLTELPLQSG